MSIDKKYVTQNTVDSLRLLEEIGGKLSFGDLLRSERERLGWTMQELGEKIGVNRQYINNIEKGVKNPSIEQAAKFAEVIGKSPEIYIEVVLQNLLDRTTSLKKYRVVITEYKNQKRA